MTRPHVTLLRLEVQKPANGLQNMVQNPSGETGAWGYVTPTVGSNLTSTNTSTAPADHAIPGWKLIYAAAGGVANAMYTEPLPIVPGQYAAASWVAPYVNSHYRARFEWLDSAKALLSSSTQTAYLTASGSTVFYSPVVAPASTAYVRLRLDFYSSGAGANPVAGAHLLLREVTVAKAATSAALGSNRTNLIKNPSLETNATFWATKANCSLARSTTVGGSDRTAALRMTSTGSDYMTATSPTGTTGWTAVPGVKHTAQARFRPGTTARQVFLSIEWYNSAGAYLGLSAGASALEVGGAFTQATVTGTAPVTAAYGALVLWVQGTTVGEIHYVDSIMVEQAATVGAYFDGATAAAGGWTYAWTGTADATTSTAVGASNLVYIEPVTYQDILGSLQTVDINREELNVGTLAATVIDAQLDPATYDLIRPGRRVRLMAPNATSGLYEALFTGKIDKAEVTYDRKRLLAGDQKAARISLSALDNAATLANTTQALGVGAIADLPYVLEGAGVPWVVDGNSNQVPSAVIVAKNEAASLMDQIAITRDVALGAAWVDRNNTFRAYNPTVIPSSVQNAVSINDLAGIEVGITGWNYAYQCTLARSTAVFRSGVASLQMTATVAGVMEAGQQTAAYVTPVLPGLTYTVAGWTRGASQARSSRMFILWWDAAGVLISGPAGPSVVGSGSTFTERTVSAIAPANAAYMTFSLQILGAAIGEVHYADDFSVSYGATPIDETVYSKADVDFATDRCINEVRITWLRYTQGGAEATEVQYGPYRDAASIATWGTRSATFTLQGATEVEANIAAYAASVLAANGTPQVRVNRVSIPINTAADMSNTKAFLDLYEMCKVTFTAKSIVQASRIVGIHHQITTTGWLLFVDFAQTGTVAPPQATPSPITSSAYSPRYKRAQSGTQNLTTSVQAAITSLGTLLVDGKTWTYSAGTFTCVVPGTYLVYGGCAIAANGTGTRRVLLLKNGGATAFAAQTCQAAPAGLTYMSCTGVEQFAAGDTLQLLALQSSGVTLATSGDGYTTVDLTKLY